MKHRFHAMSDSARRFRISDLRNDQLCPGGKFSARPEDKSPSTRTRAPPGDKQSHQMRPDKARPAGHEDSHARLRCSSAQQQSHIGEVTIGPLIATSAAAFRRSSLREISSRKK
jgi:hypothetical protein